MARYYIGFVSPDNTTVDIGRRRGSPHYYEVTDAHTLGQSLLIAARLMGQGEHRVLGTRCEVFRRTQVHRNAEVDEVVLEAYFEITTDKENGEWVATSMCD